MPFVGAEWPVIKTGHNKKMRREHKNRSALSGVLLIRTLGVMFRVDCVVLLLLLWIQYGTNVLTGLFTHFVEDGAFYGAAPLRFLSRLFENQADLFNLIFAQIQITAHVFNHRLAPAAGRRA